MYWHSDDYKPQICISEQKITVRLSPQDAYKSAHGNVCGSIYCYSNSQSGLWM